MLEKKVDMKQFREFIQKHKTIIHVIGFITFPVWIMPLMIGLFLFCVYGVVADSIDDLIDNFLRE